MVTELMHAAVCRAPYDYRVEERPRTVPGPGEVLVKVDFAAAMEAARGGDNLKTPPIPSPGRVPGALPRRCAH